MARLLFPNGERPPHDLKTTRQVLGKSIDCHIVVEGGAVAPEHAALTYDGINFWIEDLGSPAGTLVNGKFARGKVKLEIGDEVKVGTVEILFDDDPTASARLPKAEESAPEVPAVAPPPPAAPATPAIGTRAPAPAAAKGGARGGGEAPPAPRPAARRRFFRRAGPSGALAPIILGLAGVAFIAGGLWYKNARKEAAALAARTAKAAPPRSTTTAGATPQLELPTGDTAAPPPPREKRPPVRDVAPPRDEMGDEVAIAPRRNSLVTGGGGDRDARPRPPVRSDPLFDGPDGGSRPEPPPRDSHPEPRAEPVAPPAGTEPEPVVVADAQGVSGEVAALVKLLAAGDPAAKANARKTKFVSIAHEGSIAPDRASRVLALVRERIARAPDVKVVSAADLAALAKVGDKQIDLCALVVETSYTQDYARGYGRALGKVRLAPHPKTVKVEIARLQEKGGEKVLHTFNASTPPLEARLETAPAGLTDAAVWDATIEALEKSIESWGGKL